MSDEAIKYFSETLTSLYEAGPKQETVLADKILQMQDEALVALVTDYLMIMEGMTKDEAEDAIRRAKEGARRADI